jgi:8-oxo-dGTP diphosphatase
MIKVAAAMLIKDGRVLIAKRKANDMLANKWEFPGGKIEVGESPEECLRREIQEEFQVEIAVGKYFGESKYRYDHASVHLIAYWAYLENGELKPTSHSEYCWASIDELDKYDFAPADKPLVEKIKSRRVIE